MTTHDRDKIIAQQARIEQLTNFINYDRDQEVRHDCTDAGKEAAWRLAASMAGAKVGGYSE